jgi:hypothetical protein
VEIETRGEQTERGWWRDHLGFVGPLKPGTHGRSDPTGDFPTGPGVGELLPAIVAPSHDGRMVDAHAERNDGPLVMVFFRSAVW